LAEKALAILASAVEWDDAEPAEFSNHDADGDTSELDPNQERDG
jgi:hypothetical protein